MATRIDAAPPLVYRDGTAPHILDGEKIRDDFVDREPG
jgi:hypothetical protein